MLEIGAGTGRYSHALARQGYAVHAMDLSDFPDNEYDITLLPGPLYHLYTIEDKRQGHDF